MLRSTILPIPNIASEFNKDKKKFIYLSFSIGIFLFLGTALQQVALLYTDIANAAFFTIFYVPMVPFAFLIFGTIRPYSVSTAIPM